MVISTISSGFGGHVNVNLPLGGPWVLELFGVVLFLVFVFTLLALRKKKNTYNKGMLRFQIYTIFCLSFVVIAHLVFSYNIFRAADRAFLHTYSLRINRGETFQILGVTFLLGAVHLTFSTVLKLRLNEGLARFQSALSLTGAVLLLGPMLIVILNPQEIWVVNSTKFGLYNLVSVMGLAIFSLGIAATAILMLEALVKRRPITNVDISSF